MDILINKNAPWSHKPRMAPNPVTNKIKQACIFRVRDSPIEIKKHYIENGFVIIQELIPETIIDNCREHFDKICSRSVLHGSMTLRRDKDKCIEIENIFYDRVFSKYTEYPMLLTSVEYVTGLNIMGIQSKVINKPLGALVDQNQAFIPAENSVVCWTAMESRVTDNGCHYVVKKDFHGVHKPSETIILEKGDTLFIHPSYFHGVEPNKDITSRKAIMCHFTKTDMGLFNKLGPVKERNGGHYRDLVIAMIIVNSRDDTFKIYSNYYNMQDNFIQKILNQLS